VRMGVSIAGSFIEAPSMARVFRPREMGKYSRASGETMSLSQNQFKFSVRPTKPHFLHYKSIFFKKFPSKFNPIILNVSYNSNFISFNMSDHNNQHPRYGSPYSPTPPHGTHRLASKSPSLIVTNHSSSERFKVLQTRIP
jgi:hypothetical protein